LAQPASYLRRLLIIKGLRIITSLAQGVGLLLYPTPPKPSSTTHFISDGRKIRIEIYLPHHSLSNSPLPIHINLHGSGWCLPGFHQDDPFCDYIAKTVGCVVLNADYSKAPEHAWPAANNDVDAAIRWARANASERGWDPERITIGGFSAGGNLALSASIGKEGSQLKAVVAFYCPYDIRAFPILFIADVL
jgi:acetyl esterase/lipase